MKQAKVLTSNEVKRLIAVVEAGQHAERNKCAFYLTYYAGMRVKEVAALKIGDVFDSEGIAHERITLASENTKGNSARHVLISCRLRKILQAYYLTLPRTSIDFALIYSQKDYGAFSANSLCQLFAPLYAAAGINGASSHSGRRSFITKLANKGVGAKVLMHLAGHKHLSTTQRYIDVNDEMLMQAVELL